MYDEDICHKNRKHFRAYNYNAENSELLLRILLKHGVYK